MREPDTPGLGSGWRGAVGAVVVVLVLATAAATWFTAREIGEREADRLAFEAARIDDALEQRMTAYVQVLLGGLALFAGSDDVNRDEWVHYVETLRLDDRYPGFKSLSFAPAVPDAELDAFTALVRTDPLLADYTPRSPTGVPGETAIHSPILYVAPFTEENQLVLGVDMMQDPTRRTVMERARNEGEPILSPRIRLAEQTDQRAGFIAYLPITVDGEFVGWLTSAFRAEGFMGGLLGNARPPVDFELRDGTGDGDDALLYSTAGQLDSGAPRPLGPEADGRLSLTTTVQMPGRQWTVRYVAAAGFTSGTDRSLPWLVALGGLSATALLTVITRSGAGWRRQAVLLAESEAAVRHQATHDPLTGLANRALFLERLDEAFAGPPFAIAYVDIDGFKPVNDTHGHRAGDLLLQGIAGRLRSHVRAGDTVARLGGDEFAVLLADGGAPQARALDYGRHLVERLREPFGIDVDGRRVTVRIGASVGIACCPGDGADADTLVGAADAAMFEAKRSGKDRCVVAGSGAPAAPDDGAALGGDAGVDGHHAVGGVGAVAHREHR